MYFRPHLTGVEVQVAFLNLQAFLAQLQIAVMSGRSGSQVKVPFGNLSDKSSPLSILYTMLQEFLHLLEDSAGLCGVLQQRIVLLSGGLTLGHSIQKVKEDLSQVGDLLCSSHCSVLAA